MPRKANISTKPPLGAYILKKLYAIGKDQKWLCEKSGISPIYLCNVISGKASPSVKLLYRIARVIQIDADEMVHIWAEEKAKEI